MRTKWHRLQPVILLSRAIQDSAPHFLSSGAGRRARPPLMSFRALLDSSAPTSRSPERCRRGRIPAPVILKAEGRRIPAPSSPRPVRARIEEPALSLPKGEGHSEVAQASACDSSFARDSRFRPTFLIQWGRAAVPAFHSCHSEHLLIAPLPPAEALSKAEGEESRLLSF